MSAKFWEKKFHDEFFFRIFTKFSKEKGLSHQEFFSTIATIPEDGKRFQYLSSAPLPSFERTDDTFRLIDDFGRLVVCDGNSAQLGDFIKDKVGGFQPSYTRSEVTREFDELCNYTFPSACFSNPYEISRNRDSFSKLQIRFEKYDAPSTGVIAGLSREDIVDLCRQYQREHIVFPYAYAYPYYVPSFQPEAVIYFLARIPKGEENVYNNHLGEFLESQEVREWEQSLSAELALEKFHSFMSKVNDDLSHENGKNLKSIITKNLNYLIRGGVVTHSNESYEKTKHIHIQELGICWGFDDEKDMWTAPYRHRVGLIDYYNDLIEGLVGTLYKMLEFRSQNETLAHYKRMLDLLERPLRSLTEALGKTQRDAQELRAILYDPVEAIFSVHTQLADLFDDSKSIKNPDGSTLTIEHQPTGYKLLTDAQWALAHALARCRGGKINKTSKVPQSALQDEVSFLKLALNSLEHPFHSYANALIEVLGVEKNCVDTMVHAPLPKLIDYLSTLKNCLFDPFKPGTGSNELLWGRLAILLRPEVTRTLTTNLGHELSEDNLLCIAERTSSRLVTQAHLMKFVSGVVHGMAQQGSFPEVSINYIPADCVEIEPGGSALILDQKKLKTITLRFTQSITASNDKWQRFVALVSDNSENANSDQALGNLTRPFVEFARRSASQFVVDTITNLLTLKVDDNLIVKFQFSPPSSLVFEVKTTKG